MNCSKCGRDILAELDGDIYPDGECSECHWGTDEHGSRDGIHLDQNVATQTGESEMTIEEIHKMINKLAFDHAILHTSAIAYEARLQGMRIDNTVAAQRGMSPPYDLKEWCELCRGLETAK